MEGTALTIILPRLPGPGPPAAVPPQSACHFAISTGYFLLRDTMAGRHTPDRDTLCTIPLPLRAPGAGS